MFKGPAKWPGSFYAGTMPVFLHDLQKTTRFFAVFVIDRRADDVYNGNVE